MNTYNYHLLTRSASPQVNEPNFSLLQRIGSKLYVVVYDVSRQGRLESELVGRLESYLSMSLALIDHSNEKAMLLQCRRQMTRPRQTCHVMNERARPPPNDCVQFGRQYAFSNSIPRITSFWRWCALGTSFDLRACFSSYHAQKSTKMDKPSRLLLVLT